MLDAHRYPDVTVKVRRRLTGKRGRARLDSIVDELHNDG
jgi:hypothetical protein